MKSVRAALGYSAAATLSALLVVGVGTLVVPAENHPAVFAGAGLGLLVQVVVYWLLAVALFPGKRLLVMGLGMGARMVTLLVVALFAPGGLALAPLLLTLVSVFVVTSLLEPVVFQLESKRAS